MNLLEVGLLLLALQTIYFIVKCGKIFRTISPAAQREREQAFLGSACESMQGRAQPYEVRSTRARPVTPVPAKGKEWSSPAYTLSLLTLTKFDATAHREALEAVNRG